jgi:hypothetical protein
MPVLRDAYRRRVRRNRDGRLDLHAVGGDDLSLAVEVQCSGARVPRLDRPASVTWKKPFALDREVERVVRVAQVARC